MENTLGSCSSLRRRRRLRKKTGPFLFSELFLMDDIIINILSRLSAKDVLRCQCVCRGWKDLTLTRDFINLHIQCSFPMILMDYGHWEPGLLDRCWELQWKRPKIYKTCELQVSVDVDLGIQFSHDGLIVALGGSLSNGLVEGYVIYNPIYSDAVHIFVSDEAELFNSSVYNNSVYGVFFHPVQKEYCTLWLITLSLEPWKIQYKILNLESNPTWRDIKNPCTQNARISGIPPVLIDRYLYWMIEPYQHYEQHYSSVDFIFMCDIMEYDIISEEFRVLPCPVHVTVNRCDYNVNHYNVNLVDIDGVLSLVQVFPSKELVKINIWTLERNEERLWTVSDYIISSDVYTGNVVPKTIAFRGGEVVLESDRRLYVCNLKLGTFRKFRRKYNKYVEFFPHVTSVVSLRNCKSKICMVEEDENS